MSLYIRLTFDISLDLISDDQQTRVMIQRFDPNNAHTLVICKPGVEKCHPSDSLATTFSFHVMMTSPYHSPLGIGNKVWINGLEPWSPDIGISVSSKGFILRNIPGSDASMPWVMKPPGIFLSINRRSDASGHRTTSQAWLPNSTNDIASTLWSNGGY